MADYGLNDLLAELRTAQTPIASTVHEPVGNPAGPGLWHHKGMQLPAYIQHVANELKKQGHPESQAVHMAVGIVKNWAAGHDGHGNKVHPDVQAAAVKTMAEWEALKASTGGGKRFNPFHAPAGPGGGEFTSGGGGGGGSSAGGAGGHAKVKAAADSVKKHQLLQRAAADRAKAHQLEQELHVLEHQLHAHQQAAAAASHAQKTAAKTKAAAAKAAKKGGAAAKQAKATAAKTKAKVTHVHHHTGHHHTAAHHHAKAASLKTRIKDLRSQISDLLAQADHLTAQAKAL